MLGWSYSFRAGPDAGAVTAPSVGSPRAALGDLRLLRHADRLERRHRARARAAVRLRAGRRAAAHVPRARAADSARGAGPELPRGDGRRALPARGSRGRAGRARSLAARVGAIPGGPGGARGGPRRRLAARRPLEHRSRPPRRLARADRGRLRPDRRRLRDRLVQAGAGPLGRVLRAERSRPGRSRARRRQPLPRHRARFLARPADDLDQSARRGGRAPARRRAAQPDRSAGKPRHTRAGMNVRPLAEEDAPTVAALISAEEERLYGRPGRLTGADILMFLQYSKESWIWEEDGRMVASASYGVHGDAANFRGIVADKGRGLGTE